MFDSLKYGDVRAISVRLRAIVGRFSITSCFTFDAVPARAVSMTGARPDDGDGLRDRGQGELEVDLARFTEADDHVRLGLVLEAAQRRRHRVRSADANGGHLVASFGGRDALVHRARRLVRRGHGRRPEGLRPADR